MSSPIKINFKTEWFSISLILISFVLAVYFLQNFPILVPSHWNINGEVDSYSGPLAAAFLVPVLMVVMYISFLLMPYFDPKKDQYINFAPVYHKFKELILSFLFILYLMTGLNGLGYKINIGMYVPLMIGVMFIVIGLLLKKIKMNWFLGFRTPWTMSSEKVWDKTNKLGSQIMMISGVLMASTGFISNTFKIIMFILAILLLVFVLPVYSYFLYRREMKEKVKK